MHEVQALQSGLPPGAAGGGGGCGGFAGGDASDVTTQRLVEFKDVEELQQQNARLLVVNRQLSQEAEATRAEAEAAIRAEYEAGLQGLSKQLEDLRTSRKSTERMLQQVRRGWGGVGGWWWQPWASGIGGAPHGPCTGRGQQGWPSLPEPGCCLPPAAAAAAAARRWCASATRCASCWRAAAATWTRRARPTPPRRRCSRRRQRAAPRRAPPRR